MVIFVDFAHFLKKMRQKYRTMTTNFAQTYKYNIENQPTLMVIFVTFGHFLTKCTLLYPHKTKEKKIRWKTGKFVDTLYYSRQVLKKCQEIPM